MAGEKKDPLEGCHITAYEPDREYVTIAIHRSLLNNAGQRRAVIRKTKEIIEGGPSVKGVHIGVGLLGQIGQ